MSNRPTIPSDSRATEAPPAAEDSTSKRPKTRESASAPSLSAALQALANAPTVSIHGHLHSAVGLGLRASLPGARLGQRCHIEPLSDAEDPNDPQLIDAEVVGFDRDEVMLMPLDATAGIGPGARVQAAAGALSVPCGDDLIGRVLDGLGRPLDGGAPLSGKLFPIHRAAPAALRRPPISHPLPLGVRAIDSLLTVGEGQRLGVFAGSGVGKTTLLGQIARQAEVDVVVIGLVGERGRELRELLELVLDAHGRARTVVVCATSDMPPLVRIKSAHTATAIAEWFRGQGKRVLLLVDSLTRFARAGREVGLAAGEPATRRGFPPSAFAALPGLLERAGAVDGEGSITGIYTVLVEGSDLDEPVSDELRGLLDGHVVLSRPLAERGRFPAVDPITSVSRVMPRIVSERHRTLADTLRLHLQRYEEHRDLVLLGAYKRGSNPDLDNTLARIGAIEDFLRQPPDEHSPFEGTLAALTQLLSSAP